MIDLFIGIVTLFFIGTMIFCGVMLVRNSIVYRVRTNILRRSRFDPRNGKYVHVGHDALPDYDAMMWQLTKWRLADWEKDLPEGWEEK